MHISVVQSLAEVASAEWDVLAGDDDPFVEHAFLEALEWSGTVGSDSGWTPLHLLARDAAGRLVGALPLYAKDHSYGEYIFDWAWASAAQRMGARYYPKLVSMVPVTPTTGRRFLTAPNAPRADVIRALAEGVLSLARELRVSSVHLNFLEAEESALVAELGFLPRVTHQFHWENAGYADFDAFLATHRSKARKEVKRERRKVVDAGLVVAVTSGTALAPEDWTSLEGFYRDTCARKGNDAYLTPGFFARVRERFAHRVVAVLARKDGVVVAGTLNFEKGTRLYGRYWGADTAYDALHFELCYYRLIERAIERGYTRFEAGAQGLQKLRRGFLPREVHSAHWLAHPKLRDAVADYLPRETAAVREEMLALREQSPFRRDGADPADDAP